MFQYIYMKHHVFMYYSKKYIYIILHFYRIIIGHNEAPNYKFVCKGPVPLLWASVFKELIVLITLSLYSSHWWTEF